MSIQHKLLKSSTIICIVLIYLLIAGCAPQHHYAFQQFSAPQDGSILSVQGYVLNPNEVAVFEKNWNILANEMKNKSGFKTASLNSGVGDSKLILAQSEWNDLEALRQSNA